MKCILLVCIFLAVVNAQVPPSPIGSWQVNPWQGWENVPRYNVYQNWLNQQGPQQPSQQKNQTQPQQPPQQKNQTQPQQPSQQKNRTHPQQPKRNDEKGFWYDVVAAEVDILGEVLNHYNLGRIRLDY